MVHSKSEIDQSFIKMYKVRQKLRNKGIIIDQPKSVVKSNTYNIQTKPHYNISVKRLESKQSDKQGDEYV